MKKIFVYALAFALILLSGCKKDNVATEKNSIKDKGSHLKSGSMNQGPDLYYGHEFFARGMGGPVVETRQLASPEFCYFQNQFTLKIRNGNGSNNRVSSGFIKIDGNLIAGPPDFSQNADSIIKPISSLGANSILTVELRGQFGGYIELWIDGILK
jgi:hypothetical protein